MSVSNLARQWEEEARLLDGYGAGEAASAARRHARELTEALRAAEDEEFSVEASKLSGYSPRRLREMLADGSIPNQGQRGRQRIRRADLPRKANRAMADGFDPAKHAAEILR